MGEPPVRHSHGDDLTHTHATTLAPSAVELLQGLEDFAAGLQPAAALALRRLLQAGLLAQAGSQAGTAEDRAGYEHAWYRGHIATHHEHAPGASVASGAPYLYLPPWWPARAARPSRDHAGR